MKNYSVFYIISAGILMLSCSHDGNTQQQLPADRNLITVTQEQFSTGNLFVGEPVKMIFEEQVKCNGSTVTTPAGSASISTPVPGLIKRIYCTGGQKVLQGQVLFEITGNDFIELQKDLAGTANQLIRLKSEYERVKELFGEKIGTEKELIQAETEYKVANAGYSALKMKVRLIGLDESKITDGDFYESFSLKSPITGYISQINISVGQYADQQSTLAEVYDISGIHLRLDVFQKDLGNLKESQVIRFNILGDTGRSYSARLKSIGRNVNPESKTIICYAAIDNSSNSNFVNNAFVEARIVIRNDSVNAVPEESILRSEGSNYILEFVRNENNRFYLKRTKVETGRLSNGYTEILNIPDGIKLITKGAYNIRID